MSDDDLWSRALSALTYTDAEKSFASGTYLAPPATLSVDLEARVQAERAAQLLVLGGTGTGKSTRLLAAERSLSSSDVAPFYIEVSRYISPSEPRPGALVALACLARLRMLRKATSAVTIPASARTALERIHAGMATLRDASTLPDLLDARVMQESPEALEAPPSAPATLARDFAELGRVAPSVTDRALLLLLDGLDRVERVATLNGFLTEDLPVLRSLGVGVIIAGSIAWRFDLDRELRVSPDDILLHRVPDPDVDVDRDFLMQVVRQRVPAALLGDDALDLVARGSGGVMRDLLAIARAALRSAWQARRERVGLDDVRAALAALADRRLLFLDGERLDVIRSVHATGSVRNHRQALEDLLTSCDVLLRKSPDTYAVHPAVRDALDLREVA